MINLYTQLEQGQAWLRSHQGKRPHFACILGFTATGLLPGISAAGATPEDRRYTAIADAEFLHYGPRHSAQYPLPPLHQGASPVLITRVMVEQLALPFTIFNAGLLTPLSFPHTDLGGQAAACVSSGQALPLEIVQHLFKQGVEWGEKLARDRATDYLIIGECVVGGTTTALGILLGLGIAAKGCVNSSHPQCNHGQKQQLVEQGLAQADLVWANGGQPTAPLTVVAAVGDPMQVVAAGMAIAASRQKGVLLAGGTQMLAVWALARVIATQHTLPWQPDRVVVGTTGWVMADPTGDTVKLAQEIGDVSLLAAHLDFRTSQFATLRAYEQGYVKEGVGAGGCTIAAALQGYNNTQLLAKIEAIAIQANRETPTRQLIPNQKNSVTDDLA